MGDGEGETRGEAPGAAVKAIKVAGQQDLILCERIGTYLISR
jgi:hypothetical protein